MMPEPETGTRRFQQGYSRSLESIADQLQGFSGLRHAEDSLRQIVAGMRQPFSVAVCGHVKRGKSSLINALIGQNLAVVNTNTATATINHIIFAKGEQLGMFTAHWHDRVPETLPLDHLKSDWTGTGQHVEANANAVDYLELYADAPFLREIQIIDTPGLGAAADFHERKIQQFLKDRKTDAILYVLDSQGMEHDVKALKTFRESGMQTFSPYNCLGVIHLWDTTLWNSIHAGNSFETAYADIRNKAATLADKLSEYVAAIIPVSAPLAIISKHAAPEFWNGLHALLQSYTTAAPLEKDLSLPERFYKGCLKELWHTAKQMGMPLESFRVMLYYLKTAHSETAQDAREKLLNLSGLPELENLLDRKFFKEKAIISMRQTRAKAIVALENIYLSITQKCQEEEWQLQLEERVLQEIFSPDLRQQVQALHQKHLQAFETLQTQFINIDTVRLRTKEKIERADNAYALLREWPEKTCFFTEEETRRLEAFLSAVIEERPVNTAGLPGLLRKACILESNSDRKTRTCATYLRDLINQFPTRS